MEGHDKEQLKNINYEVFILALSLLSVVNWVLFLILDNEEVNGVIIFVDILLVIIFLSDFFYRLFSAESKRNYFLRQYGWLDLIGSFPLPQFRIARIGRVIRAIIMMRELGGKSVFRGFVSDRVGTAVYLVAFLIIIVLQFGSLAVLSFEHGSPGSTIETPGDAVWWSIVTMSTVGYGDTAPVTAQGRIIGMLVITIGVALFGVVTATLANRFVEPVPEAEAFSEVDQEADNIGFLINEVKSLRAAQDQSKAELEAQLKSIRVLIEDRYGNNQQ